MRLRGRAGGDTAPRPGEHPHRHRLSDTPYTVQPGDRIAQLAVMPVVQAELERVDSLDDTGRGTGGFGSTGK